VKKRILLINGHPDASPARFCSALAGAYADGAEAAGHEIRRLDIASLSFPILRNPQEFPQKATNPDIVEAQRAFLWAEHLVFIFPLWLGGVPALLKAFMEALGCGEFLLGQGSGKFPKGNLAGRSARIIVTMGMPALAYRLYFRAHGTKAFARGILKISGVGPIRTSCIGGIGASAARCTKLLEKARHLGMRGL
jgi:putative NADPH-quinone reductase